MPIALSAPRSYALGSLLLLGACASLPSSGPTASQIRKSARSNENSLGFRIVDIDSAVVGEADERARTVDMATPTLSKLAIDGRNDAVGPGDVLAISVYEVGVSLFGAQAASLSGGNAEPAAHAETFPAVTVDRDGMVTLPYIGRLHVAGLTAGNIQEMVVRGLRGKSQSPQALVIVRNNISGTVFVGGEVRKPGRFELTLQRERLLDAIALGGGASFSSEDTIVRFSRDGRMLEERLGRIRSGAPDDLVLIPGDRIELIKRPRTFIVLGATSKIAQVPFETGDLSLAEAVARAGGPSDAQADPTAVFLFRYDPAVEPANAKPVIYRLNMMAPASYFLSQRFFIHDKDVIYVANAGANRPAKLVNIINQLFSPFVAARAVTR